MTSPADFWSFSLSFYGQHGAEAPLLGMQDQGAADVNLILLMLWAALRSRLLSEKEILAANSSVAEWQRTVVIPLRKIRRQMKPSIAGFEGEDSEYLRNRIKTIELEAEHLEQLHLASQIDWQGGASEIAPDTIAEANIATYGKVLMTEFDRQQTAGVIAAFRSYLRKAPTGV